MPRVDYDGLWRVKMAGPCVISPRQKCSRRRGMVWKGTYELTDNGCSSARKMCSPTGGAVCTAGCVAYARTDHKSQLRGGELRNR
jgi:hypothetical protein